MSTLRDIVAEPLGTVAMTVAVGGDTVELTYPTYEVQVDLQTRMTDSASATTGDNAQSVGQFKAEQSLITIEAIQATVLGHDDFTIDDWKRIIVRAEGSPDGSLGEVKDLVNAALRLCGFNVETDATDNVAEVDAAMGDSPT